MTWQGGVEMLAQIGPRDLQLTRTMPKRKGAYRGLNVIITFKMIEPFTPEQEFGEMTLSHHDHYEPTSDEDSEEDELEFDSGASVLD